MLHDHAVVWIDHNEAHVQSFTRDESDSALVRAHGQPSKVHHRKGSIGGAKAPEEREFFARIGEVLGSAHEVLVVGVETVDHPIDGQLLEHARRFFKAADRMLVQPGTRRT